MRFRQKFFHFAAHGHELRGGVHAVGPDIQDSGVDLIDEPRHTHHEEFVHVGAEDGEKLHALEQWISFVLRFLQHAELKRKQAQFAVDIEHGRIQRRNFR